MVSAAILKTSKNTPIGVEGFKVTMVFVTLFFKFLKRREAWTNVTGKQIEIKYIKTLSISKTQNFNLGIYALYFKNNIHLTLKYAEFNCNYSKGHLLTPNFNKICKYIYDWVKY